MQAQSCSQGSTEGVQPKGILGGSTRAVPRHQPPERERGLGDGVVEFALGTEGCPQSTTCSDGRFLLTCVVSTGIVPTPPCKVEGGDDGHTIILLG